MYTTNLEPIWCLAVDARALVLLGSPSHVPFSFMVSCSPTSRFGLLHAVTAEAEASFTTHSFGTAPLVERPSLELPASSRQITTN